MAKYTKKNLEKVNKNYKKIFKESGCRILTDEEVQNVNDSLKLFSSSDVKIIESAKSGNYSEFNNASPLVRNYIGTLSVNKLTAETQIEQNQLSLSNPQVKKYVQEHVLDAGFRVGLSALKHKYPENPNFKELDEYANEYLLSKTLSMPSKQNIDRLTEKLGSKKAQSEIDKNLSKQVVMAKILFMAQLGKYSVKENASTTEYKGSIAETFAHGGRTNFILPYNDVKNEVLTAFEGGEIGKNAEIKSRIAATHSATLRKFNYDLSVDKESKEEKPKFSELGKIFSNQYGMNVAIGGVGELGPNKEPIVADGSSGHVYIRKQQGSEYACGSLMIGIESAASFKTSSTGHFHTPLAKSSKQSAFLADKFGPGDKTDGKTVDLSGLESEKLALVLNEFEKGYVSLQKSNNEKALNLVNELLSGKRLTENGLIALMSKALGMQKDFAAKIVNDARTGLNARVEKEKENFEKQFKDVLGVDFKDKSVNNSIKIMQKTNGKWEMVNLFSENDTQAQKFGKFWKNIKNGEQLYLTSETKLNPTKINVDNKTLSLGNKVEKQNLNQPQIPNVLKRALHKLTNGLLFNKSIMQYEKSKDDFEKQQAINSFIEEHKPIVEQSQKQARNQLGQDNFRQELEKLVSDEKIHYKSPVVKQPVVKSNDSRQI